MGFDEITPHLYKIATLYLKNQKRKVGWLFVEHQSISGEESLQEVYFLSVQKGKKYQEAIKNRDHSKLAAYSERIPVELIERIRSSI